MKNITSLLLLISFFVEAQYDTTLPPVNDHICKDVIVTVSDVPMIKARNFSISINNFPTEIPLSEDIIKLEVCVHNKSSYLIVEDRFKLYYHSTLGSVINKIDCKFILGGVGSVCIPPIPPGIDAFLEEKVELPDNYNSSTSILSEGDHSYTLELTKLNNYTNSPIKATAELNFRVTAGNDSLLENCNPKKIVKDSQLISAYPNPFIDRVIFDITKLPEFKFPIHLELYSNNGILKDSKFFAESSSKVLEYYNYKLNSGLYHYKLISENNIITGTLIHK